MPEDTPEILTLDAPATALVHVPGEGQVRVRLDAGEHPLDHDDPATRAAIGEIARVLAGRADDQVPETVDAVKDWVGDDPDRAAVALEAERSRPAGPRKSLEPWLAGLADPDDGGAGSAGDDEES